MKNSMLWTLSRLASEAGLARQHIAERLRDVPTRRRGAPRTPGWRLKTFLRPLIAASDLQRERTRLAAAQADIAELEAARKRGELLPADEVQRADEAVFSAIRDAFLALPAALADQLCEVAAAEAAAGIDRVLRERIEEVLVDAFEMEFEDEEE